MEELPEDFLNRLNGDDRDSNLFPSPDGSSSKKGKGLPSDLQKQLDEYNSNFEALTLALGDTSMLDASAKTELKIEKTREMLVNALPSAVQTIIELSCYSLSDNVRLKASTYIIDKTMGKENGIVEEDEATKLLRKLAGGE